MPKPTVTPEVLALLSQQAAITEVRFDRPGRYKLPLIAKCRGATTEGQSICLELVTSSGEIVLLSLSGEAASSAQSFLAVHEIRGGSSGKISG